MEQNSKKKFAPAILLAIVSILAVAQLAFAQTASYPYSIEPASATIKAGQSYTFNSYFETQTGQASAYTDWEVIIPSDASAFLGQNCRTLGSSSCTIYSGLKSKDTSIIVKGKEIYYEGSSDQSTLYVTKRGL